MRIVENALINTMCGICSEGIFLPSLAMVDCPNLELNEGLSKASVPYFEAGGL